MLNAALFVIGGYLIGSIASAIIVCRLFGLPDPRSDGSGNPGATNVLRLGGKKAAAITLLGDVLKGLLPVLLAAELSQPPAVVAATAGAAFLGHLFPVFFGFKGGKGVATAFGAVAGMSWLAVAGMGLTWLVVAGVSRYSSLSSLLAVTLMPAYLWYFTGAWSMVAGGAVIALFTIARHHANISRLVSGAEPKIGEKSS